MGFVLYNTLLNLESTVKDTHAHTVPTRHTHTHTHAHTRSHTHAHTRTHSVSGFLVVYHLSPASPSDLDTLLIRIKTIERLD